MLLFYYMHGYFNYFKGKVCTVLTVQVNFRFKAEQMTDYFSGFVEQIDEHGIWLVHHLTGCRTYILLAHVVSITEEQMLFEDNPEHAKIIEEYRKEKPITAAKTAIPATSPYINPNALADIAKKAKEAFGDKK